VCHFGRGSCLGVVSGKQGKYLDLDQLLHTFRNDKMLISRRCFRHHTYITRPHPPPPTIRIGQEGFFIRGVVVPISHHNARRLHNNLPLLIVVRDVGPFGRKQPDPELGEYGATATKPDVVLGRYCDGCRSFRETWGERESRVGSRSQANFSRITSTYHSLAESSTRGSTSGSFLPFRVPGVRPQ
jgi:hypothetical protein